MTTIKLKNGSGAPAASDLVQGEPALDLTNKRLYSEDASGNVIEVGTNPTNLTVTGNVGIANTNPSAFDQVGADTLVVGSGSGEQGITVYSGTANNGVLAFADGTTTTEQYQGFIGYNHSGNFMRFFTAASERMRIDSSGNVGIGSTGNAKLQVFGPSASPSLGTYANSAAIISNNAGGYGVSFSVDGTGTGYIQAQNFTSSNAYNLSLNPVGGNVGIGTTGADSLLHVGTGTNTDGTDVTITIGGDSANSRQSLITKKIQSDDRALQIHASGGGSDEDIRFFSDSSTERMRIDDSGNLLVGKTNTGHVGDGAHLGTSGCFLTAASTAPLTLRRSAAGVVIQLSRGGVNEGTLTMNTGAAPTLASGSDIRLKENVTEHCLELQNILSIKTRQWDWKDKEKGSGEGVVAQELEGIYPDLVFEDNDGMLNVKDFGPMTTRLVKAIQELSAQVNDLKAEVTALKGG